MSTGRPGLGYIPRGNHATRNPSKSWNTIFLLGDPQVALESPCHCHSRAARVESQLSPFDQTEMGKCSSESGASPKKQHESLLRISLSRTSGPILIMIKVSPVAKFERETTPLLTLIPPKMEGPRKSRSPFFDQVKRQKEKAASGIFRYVLTHPVLMHQKGFGRARSHR